VSLGRDFKTTFDDLSKRLSEQRSEAESLRGQLCEAGIALTKANDLACNRLSSVLQEEKERSAHERTALLSQISSLFQNYGDSQDKRMEAKVISVQSEIRQSNQLYERQQGIYSTTMDAWSAKEQLLVENMLQARESVKLKIKKDWTVSHSRNSSPKCPANNLPGRQ